MKPPQVGVPSTILLVRHGRSAHAPHNGWLDAEGVRRWRVAYDEAGIEADDVPPPALVAESEEAGIVVSSDLQRAIASAERLAPGRPIPVSPLLRETPRAIPRWIPLPLPIAAWDALMTVQWGYHILRGSDTSPDERRQAIAAAAWLAKLARAHPSIVAITHGVFRRQLAARLGTLGWRPGATRRTFRHWSVWPMHALVDQTGVTPASITPVPPPPNR